MRKCFYLLLILSVTFFECQVKVIKDYTVIIKPIGPSDVPRTTFYIALKHTTFRKKNPFTDEILTDEQSLRNIVAFVEDNGPATNDTLTSAGWGSLEISIYNNKHLIVAYNLINKAQSKNYLRLLINNLIHENSDEKLIKLLKEETLADIGY